MRMILFILLKTKNNKKIIFKLLFISHKQYNRYLLKKKTKREGGSETRFRDRRQNPNATLRSKSYFYSRFYYWDITWT